MKKSTFLKLLGLAYGTKLLATSLIIWSTWSAA
jgi:hypothetical protein